MLVTLLAVANNQTMESKNRLLAKYKNNFNRTSEKRFMPSRKIIRQQLIICCFFVHLPCIGIVYTTIVRHPTETIK